MLSFEALAAVLIPNILGFLSFKYMIKGQKTAWFKKLKFPKLTPPPWIGGFLWVLHFTCMGFASYLIWNTKGFSRGSKALSFYSANLFFCFSWGPVFYGLRSLKGGFVIGLLNTVAAIGTFVEFYKINFSAGLLMIPFTIWITFASFLSYKIYILNKKNIKQQ